MEKMNERLKKPIIKEYNNEKINIKELKDNEKEAIYKTIIMMSYNPSCARIFKKGINEIIREEIYNFIYTLYNVNSQEEYNQQHKDFLDSIIYNNTIMELNGNRISYGQAQKGLNVFLKVFVDWANLPNDEISNRIRNYLHCPLDSRVMKSIKKMEPELYSKYGKLPTTMKNIVTYDEYDRWQQLIGEITGNEKRVLLDVIWYLEGKKNKEVEKA